MDALVEAHLVVVPGTYRAALVVSSTALMLGYRTRPVFVPVARRTTRWRRIGHG